MRGPLHKIIFVFKEIVFSNFFLLRQFLVWLLHCFFLIGRLSMYLILIILFIFFYVYSFNVLPFFLSKIVLLVQFQ